MRTVFADSRVLDWRAAPDLPLPSFSNPQICASDRNRIARRTPPSPGALPPRSRLSTSCLFSHQFFRCAQRWDFEAILFDYSPYSAVQLGVGNVAAVPGQQVLAAIYSSHSDMSSIAGGFPRNWAFANE